MNNIQKNIVLEYYKWVKTKLLRKVIRNQPIIIDQEMLSSDRKETVFKIADNKKLVIDKSQFHVMLFLGGVLAIGPFVYEVLERDKEIKKEVNRKAEIYSSIHKEWDKEAYTKELKKRSHRTSLINLLFYSNLLMGSFMIFLSIPRNEKYILDREKGEITYPYFWFKSFKRSFRKTPFATYNKSFLGILYYKNILTAIIDRELPDEYFALLVWYMDKNRPLPPGSAFDPFRERDYERRKAEGFPLPLYRSEIDTPEIDGTVPDIYKGTKKEIEPEFTKQIIISTQDLNKIDFSPCENFSFTRLNKENQEINLYYSLYALPKYKNLSLYILCESNYDYKIYFLYIIKGNIIYENKGLDITPFSGIPDIQERVYEKCYFEITEDYQITIKRDEYENQKLTTSRQFTYSIDQKGEFILVSETL